GAEDDQVGAAHRLGGVERIDIAQAQFPRFIERFLAPGGDGNDLHQALPARRQRNGGSDKADTDQRQLAKMGTHWVSSMDLSTRATARIACSEPMEMRRPLSMP